MSTIDCLDAMVSSGMIAVTVDNDQIIKAAFLLASDCFSWLETQPASLIAGWSIIARHGIIAAADGRADYNKISDVAWGA